MAGSLNKVQILGNVGKDPEVRTTQTGMKIVNLTVATEESWKDKSSGERKSRTEWHRVVCFNEGLGGVMTTTHRHPPMGVSEYDMPKPMPVIHTDMKAMGAHLISEMPDSFPKPAKADKAQVTKGKASASEVSNSKNERESKAA